MHPNWAIQIIKNRGIKKGHLGILKALRLSEGKEVFRKGKFHTLEVYWSWKIQGRALRGKYIFRIHGNAGNGSMSGRLSGIVRTRRIVVDFQKIFSPREGPGNV